MSTLAGFAPARAAHLERALWLTGAALAAVSAAACAADPTGFLRSYLFALLYWLGVSLGAIGLLLLHDLTGGAWGRAVRPLLAAAAGTVPLTALLFVPVALGVRALYPWAGPASPALTAAVAPKAAYLDVPFWITRAAVDFGLWIVLARALRRERPGARPAWAGPALVAFVFSASFAAVDWSMSLEPRWHSSLYGLIVVTGQALAALAWALALAGPAAGRRGWIAPLPVRTWNDLGSLLLTLVMLWGYLAVSQWIVVWSGNLAAEIPWYVPRARGGWAAVAGVVIAFQLALPFLALLLRGVRSGARRLPWLALVVALVQLVDVFWRVTPAFRPAGPVVRWTDVLAPLAVGALWAAAFVRSLARAPARLREAP